MNQLDNIKFIGHDLVRPECVLATQFGNIYVADFRGGVTQIKPDGTTQFYGGSEVLNIGKLKPNGICLLKDGSFLVAHLGDEVGGVYKVKRDGQIEPFVTHIDGKPLPPCNFIYLDKQGRLWLTVSTRKTPRASAYTKNVSDGFIALVDGENTRIVADNIGYTNEVAVTDDGHTLYVNATFTRETLSFDINNTNDLVNRKVVAGYGKGIFPDGITLDTSGNLWVTSIISNSVLKVSPDTGASECFLSDMNDAHIDWVESAYQNNALGRPHLDNVKSQCLKNISSLAFAGESLNRMLLGCLLGDQIAYLDSNVTGCKPAHWHFDD